MKKEKPDLWFHSEESRRREVMLARTGGMLGTPNEGLAKEIENRQAREDVKKLAMLAGHFGIPPSEGMFTLLALTLARILYPEPKRKGRKTKWSPLLKAALVVEVERIVGNSGIHLATKRLAKREPWASFLDQKSSNTASNDPAEALRQVYYEYKDNPWSKMARDAFKYDEYMGTVSEWDAMVIDLIENPFQQ